MKNNHNGGEWKMKENKSKFGVVDRIEIVHRDKDGNIKSKRIINNGFFHHLLCKLGLRHNSITSAGMAACAGLIGNTGTITAFADVGIGTGTTEANVTNTQLETVTGISAATSTSRVSTSYTNDTLQFVKTFSSSDGLTGTSNVTEVACFNGTINGTSIMLLRQVYSPADVCQWVQGDTLSVTVKIQIEQGA